MTFDGTFASLSAADAGAVDCFRAMNGWAGDTETTSMTKAFAYMAKLTTAPAVIPAGITGMNSTFLGASSFNSDISQWDTSQVHDMSGMFSGAVSFDQDLSGWDVERVGIWTNFRMFAPRLSTAHVPPKFR